MKLNLTLDDLEMRLKRDFRHGFLDAFDEARKDGNISDDEKALLDKLTSEFEVYKEALDEAFEDGIITKQEEEQLEAHREEIIHNIVMTANVDDNISAEEAKIIHKLSAYLINNKRIKFWQVFGTHKN